ncbi:MAG: hypothetical protein ABI723_23080 [Bacteroidia bacterium]
MKVKNYIATASLCAALLIANSASAQNWILGGNSPAGTDTLGNKTNQSLRIITNNVSRVFIKKSGQVGIGTNNPAEKLDVNGNIKSNGTLYDAVGNSTNWNTAYGWGNHAAAGYLTAETDPQVGANVTNYVSKWNGTALVNSNIFSNGTFVGVNTTSPAGASQFDVGNTNASYGGMYINSSGAVGARKPFYGYALSGGSSCWTYFDEASSSFKIYNNGDRVTVDNQGQVGIGTTTPGYYLDIQASTTYRALNAVSSYVGSVGQIVNFGRTSAPSAGNDILQITVPAGSPDDFQFIEADRGGTINFAVNGNGATGIGGSALTGVGLNVQLGSDVGPASGGYAVFGATTSLSVGIDNNEIMARNNGVVSPLYLNNSGGNVNMCVASGSVNIGNSTGAAGYILSVDGKVIAEEVRVELSGNWPDYVFGKEHKLMSIDELEQHVNEYKHLPGIPSACEVEESGIMLGEMQTKTIEKVEENSLYIIQLNKKIEAQNSVIQKLMQEVDALKNK